MNDITITVDERLIVAICDAALKNQGVQMLQACGTILNAIQQAKSGALNGQRSFTRPAEHSNAEAGGSSIDH